MAKYDTEDFENLTANLPNCIECPHKRVRQYVNKRGHNCLEYYCNKTDTNIALPFSAQHSIPEWCPVKLEFKEETNMIDKSEPQPENSVQEPTPLEQRIKQDIKELERQLIMLKAMQRVTLASVQQLYRHMCSICAI